MQIPSGWPIILVILFLLVCQVVQWYAFYKQKVSILSLTTQVIIQFLAINELAKTVDELKNKKSETESENK